MRISARMQKVVYMAKKLFGKLNIVDILLILIIAAGIALAAYKIWFSGPSESPAQEADFMITYICESYPEDILSQVSSGDICIDADFGVRLGEVQVAEIRYAEHGEQQFSKAGITISAPLRAAKAENGITHNGIAYLVGKRVNLIAGDVYIPVYISDIRQN